MSVATAFPRTDLSIYRRTGTHKERECEQAIRLAVSISDKKLDNVTKNKDMCMAESESSCTGHVVSYVLFRYETIS